MQYASYSLNNILNGVGIGLTVYFLIAVMIFIGIIYIAATVATHAVLNVLDKRGYKR